MAGREVKTLEMARVFLLVAILFAVVASGCRRAGPDEEAEQQESSQGESGATIEYPPSLSADSSPEQVVRVLIQALDQDDTSALGGLVAVESEVEAVEAIYRRHGRESTMKPEQVAGATAAGWAATYAFFREGETEVIRSSVNGDTAVVIATGKKIDGTPSSLKIKLVRTDGLWRVRAGLESVEQ